MWRGDALSHQKQRQLVARLLYFDCLGLQRQARFLILLTPAAPCV
jgi:hypothetical protein